MAKTAAALVVVAATPVPAQPAVAERVGIRIAPVTASEDLAAAPFDAKVRLTVPARGRLQLDSFPGQPPSYLWDGPHFSAGGHRCRVTVELSAWAQDKRPAVSGTHTVRRGGVTFHLDE